MAKKGLWAGAALAIAGLILMIIEAVFTRLYYMSNDSMKYYIADVMEQYLGEGAGRIIIMMGQVGIFMLVGGILILLIVLIKQRCR